MVVVAVVDPVEVVVERLPVQGPAGARQDRGVLLAGRLQPPSRDLRRHAPLDGVVDHDPHRRQHPARHREGLVADLAEAADGDQGVEAARPPTPLGPQPHVDDRGAVVQPIDLDPEGIGLLEDDADGLHRLPVDADHAGPASFAPRPASTDSTVPFT